MVVDLTDPDDPMITYYAELAPALAAVDRLRAVGRDPVEWIVTRA